MRTPNKFVPRWLKPFPLRSAAGAAMFPGVVPTLWLSISFCPQATCWLLRRTAEQVWVLLGSTIWVCWRSWWRWGEQSSKEAGVSNWGVEWRWRRISHIHLGATYIPVYVYWIHNIQPSSCGLRSTMAESEYDIEGRCCGYGSHQYLPTPTSISSAIHKVTGLGGGEGWRVDVQGVSLRWDLDLRVGRGVGLTILPRLPRIALVYAFFPL